MAIIGSFTYHSILHDIERGLFAEYDGRISEEYYDEQKGWTILVSTRNDGFELAELAVEIIDERGDEQELAEELWRYMRRYAERALLEAEREARSEAQHIKQLWRSAYA